MANCMGRCRRGKTYTLSFMVPPSARVRKFKSNASPVSLFFEVFMHRFSFFGFIRSALAMVLIMLGWVAQAQGVFKVTAIPDESPTELARKAAPLVKYLEKTLGRPVEFTPVTDYAASVEALVNKQVDMAWYGGFTFVQANVRSGGKVVPLVQREEDEKFRSVFITSDPSIKTLADLKGKNVSFGSQSSTSGHLMPRRDRKSVV